MGDPPSAPAPVRPRRGMTALVKLPRLSGKASAAWLVVCFALPAALIPAVLRLPRWVDFEIVLGVWWAIWLGVLTRLLYTGQRVSHDYEMRPPHNWFRAWSRSPTPPAAPVKTSGDPNASWWNGFFWGSLFEEVEVIGFLVAVALIVLVAAIWFVVEVAVPVILFLLYFTVRGMLAAVVNDRHHCKGKPFRALAWAFAWATLYTAPLAAAVWFVHYAVQRQEVA